MRSLLKLFNIFTFILFIKILYNNRYITKLLISLRSSNTPRKVSINMNPFFFSLIFNLKRILCFLQIILKLETHYINIIQFYLINNKMEDDLKVSNGNNQTGVESNDHKSCNCEKSKCLKLYCECFAKNLFCGNSCNCKDCHNNLKN